MIRPAAIALLLVLAGCSPAASPADKPPPKKAGDIVETVRRLFPEKAAPSPTVRPEPPKAAPRAAVPTPKAKPGKKVERTKAKPRKAVRRSRARVPPQPRRTKAPAPPAHQRAPQADAGSDLPWPCWMVRMNTPRDKKTGEFLSNAELAAIGRKKGVKLTRKQEQQALACLGR